MSSKKITTTEVESQKSIKSKVDEKLIISSRITEKASKQSEVNAYTFVVEKSATKHQLLAEVKRDYKVTPKYINIINLPRRNVFVRGRKGTETGTKKAIVFLNKGDTIKLS